ncbi:pyocin knob domain-containing protein [Zhongshania sp.]|uniref:pyocin knob domain-containing protein n=1 Tax=Zhongshania sp. TaxID=1971902 RepID=UPI003566B6D0
MPLKVSNNAIGRLASAIASTDTVIPLQAGEGALFPELTGSDWFPITLVQLDGGNNIVKREICRCSARTGDSLTVTRAEEGTQAQSFSAGDRVELRLTKAAIDTFIPSEKANTAEAQAGVDDAKFVSPLGVHEAFGQFGLGKQSALLTSNWNTATKTAFYRSNSSQGQANSPDDAATGWEGVVIASSSTSAQQIVWRSGVSAVEAWTRTFSGAWSAWRNILHSGGGTVTAGTVKLNDSIDLVLGTDGDAKLRFNGTRTVLDLITGNLAITDGTNDLVTLDRATGNMALAGALAVTGNVTGANLTGLWKDARYFETTQISVAPGLVSTQNHGLGARPKKLQVFLECVIAVAGYAVGDYIESSHWFDNGAPAGITVYANSTVIGVVVGGDYSGNISVFNRTTGARVETAGTNWRIRAHAFA